MGSISSEAEIARRILAACLEGRPWDNADLRRLIERGSVELFSIVAEGLSDRFDPALAEPYGAIFSEAIAAARPEFSAAELRARYDRVRRERRFAGAVSEVVVLSRVTLGADIAVTSVILDGAKRAFPNARILFAGGGKNYELFAGDPRIGWLPVTYNQWGALEERLDTGLSTGGALVIDPDSRITQLGLLPVCPESAYFFFDSRGYGGEGGEPLACLASRWMEATFGVKGARPYLALREDAAESPRATASFGVGGNAAKRVADPFEARLLAALAERFGSILLDTGAGEEESERARRAIAACPDAARARIRTFEGSFASFAARIARSTLYVGYDSAGQHAAAALGVPLAAVFAGFPSERFAARWRPTGSARSEVVLLRNHDPGEALARTLAAADAATMP